MLAHAATAGPARLASAHGDGRRQIGIGLKRLGLAYAWITFASIGIVSFEPAPYDVLILGAVVLLPLLGLVRFTQGAAIYVSLWAANIAAGFLASSLAPNTDESSMHTAITLHLAISSVLVMAFVAARPEANARLTMSAYMVAALIAAVTGLIGYFSLAPGAFDLFTEYGRLRGTFKDPNVLGAFLVPALLYAFNAVLHRRTVRASLWLAAMPVLFAGILLTFSRGAWINLAVSLAVYAFLIFSTASTHRQRLKLVLAAMVAGVVALGVLVAANSVPEVAELMRERASFDQSYDKGPEGRFGGQQKAARVILDYPLGLGAAVFHDKYHHEDVHEVYLSMFLNAGWVGGLTYITLVLLTLWLAARRAVQDRVGGVSAVLCASFIGMVLEGLVIDSDHWRHFFLLMGMIWGVALGTQTPGSMRSLRRSAT
jgi:hypothetical protein